jgi:hypothetical protein
MRYEPSEYDVIRATPSAASAGTSTSAPFVVTPSCRASHAPPGCHETLIVSTPPNQPQPKPPLRDIASAQRLQPPPPSAS